LISDGVLPSNEGRGYVLRRIMRRAIRYGRNIGLTRPFLHETAKVVFDVMKPAYPELTEASAFITSVIQNEETRFSETLDYGLRLLNDTLADMDARGKTEVPGDIVFKLYDTFGFPVDIVRDVVRDRKLTIDMDGFDSAMAEQKARSRSVAAFSEISDAYRRLSAEGFKPEFTGYEGLSDESKVLLLVVNGKEVDAASAGDAVEIVTEKTPFYAESGGQVGDTGRITAPETEVAVVDTIKDPTGLIIHKGTVLTGSLRRDAAVTLEVNADKRSATALNHTATHILHRVLRRVLGDHVKQSGSMVAPDRFRFDFTHFSQVTADQLEEIERQVNRRIRQNIPVSTEEMDAEAAFSSGATALFEEKYGDRVRVVSLADFSKELCGGTHTSRTGNIGLFKVVSESSIASGVRRIEGVTGEAAVARVQQAVRTLHEAAQKFRDRPEALPEKIDTLLSEQRTLEKQVEKLKSQLAEQQASGDSEEGIETVNGISLLIRKVAIDSPAALRDLADRFRDRIGSGVVVLGSAVDGKVLLIAVVSKDLIGKVHAGDLVKAAAAEVGGGGGGRPDMAQAGGSKPENIDKALAKVREMIEKL
jgi:alanyl-tRNA synthetase